MKTTLPTIMMAAALLTIAAIPMAVSQSGPPDPEVRALRQTNSELMQAWVGARTALTATQDQLTIAQAKIVDLQAQIPRKDDGPKPTTKSIDPTSPAEK